jgi:capsular exopolysaccharide synthesis family protein
MNRVSDAMRRAGHEDDTSAVVPDDTAFVSGENGSGDSGGDQPPPDDHAAAEAVRGELVPERAPLHTIPAVRIDTTRGDSGEDIRLHDILRLLWRRRWLMGGVVAICLSAAVTYNRTTPPVYELTAKVLVEPTAQQVVPFRSSGEDPGRFDYLVTQVDVLRSRSLVRKTAQLLELQQGAQQVPVREATAILNTLNVIPTRSQFGDSRVLNVSMQSTNAERAAHVVNAHAQAYVDQNLENLRRGNREASEWLNERLAGLRSEVNSAQGALASYREQMDAVSLEERQNIVVDKLRELSSAVTKARGALIEKQGLYQQLLDLEARNADLDTFPPVQSDASLQAIRRELAELRKERTRLSVIFQDSAQEMKDVDTAIGNQERRLATETAKVVESFKTEYRGAQLEEKGLMAELAAQNDAVLELNRKSIGYGELQRQANSIQEIFNTVMTRLRETELSGDLPSNNIRILDIAEAPGVAVWPRAFLNIAIALIGGSVLAAGLVFGLEFLSPRLVDPEDITSALDLPLLGTTPKVAKFRGARPADLEAVPGAFREAIRHIRAQIFLSAASSTVRTLAVTSARPGEGKTVMATSLAISIAMSGRRVLLVDGDLRSAQIARLFDISRAPGLSNILTGEIKPSEALVESPIKGLYVLPAGDQKPDPGDLLNSERLHQLMSGLRRVFDVVVFDCPPVMAVADASIVASAAASVVFVVGSGRTSRSVAQTAVQRLEAVQARILGVVLNGTKSSAGDYYAPYYAREDAVTRA